jgi:hypothetical protein
MPTLLKMRVPPPTDWSEFEDITRSALKVKWRSSDMQRNGRNGQKQHGIDVYGHDDLSRLVGIQCRNKDDTPLKMKEVLEAVAAAETYPEPLAAFYMATTLSRDAKLQAEALTVSEARVKAGKFPLGILFWEDLYEELVGDTAEFAKHYPQLVPAQPALAANHELASPTVISQPINPALRNVQRASQEVYAFAHDLTAGLKVVPDTDWNEVCETIAIGFGRYESELSDILRDHGIYLSDAVKRLVQTARGIASSGKHHVQFVEDEGPVPDVEAVKAADAFHEHIAKAAVQARAELRKQAGLD